MIIESDLWASHPHTLKVGIYLLVVANHEDGNVGSVPVLRGQTYRTLSRIAEECELSIKAVRIALANLVRMGYVTKKPCDRAHKGQVLTIVKYETYQNPSNYQGKRKRQSKRQSEKTKRAHNNKDKELNNPKTKEGSAPKKQFLDYVFLEENQYRKLQEKLGESTLEDYIGRLDEYIGSKGVKYKCHYKTILSWYRKDKPKSPAQQIIEDVERMRAEATW